LQEALGGVAEDVKLAEMLQVCMCNSSRTTLGQAWSNPHLTTRDSDRFGVGY